MNITVMVNQSVGANGANSVPYALRRDVCDPVTLAVLPPQFEFSFHAVGRRHPQHLQRTVILISAIAKSSPFLFRED